MGGVENVKFRAIGSLYPNRFRADNVKSEISTVTVIFYSAEKEGLTFILSWKRPFNARLLLLRIRRNNAAYTIDNRSVAGQQCPSAECIAIPNRYIECPRVGTYVQLIEGVPFRFEIRHNISRLRAAARARK